MKFYLGTHEPSWLGRSDVAVPLFVSHRRLMRYKTHPRAVTGWALDSGGFSELSIFGEWKTQPADYARAVVGYQAEIGNLEWAAVQDWMCEAVMLKRTGLTIAEHQARTIKSYLDLCDLEPAAPWAPVLQGWALGDYLNHVEQYARAGVDLAGLPIVGVGTLCRRQRTAEAEEILQTLAGLGLRLHGFGFKLQGLENVAGALDSSDSMAWSLHARKRPALPGCHHKTCASCPKYALRWRGRVLSVIAEARPRAYQQSFGLGGA